MLWLFGIALVAGLAWYAWRRKRKASAAPNATVQRGGGQVDE